jgi:hypothetical protein
MLTNHNKSRYFAFLLVLLSSISLAEPESIWEKAKRNAAPETIHLTKKQTNDASTAPFVIEKTHYPILLKIVVPWGADMPVATIYYRGGRAPYREGDFVPPFYRLTGITPNLVSLQCLAIKKEDKDNCITELSFSGVYQ